MKRIATIIVCIMILLIFSSALYANTNQSIKIETLGEAHKDYIEIIGLDEEIKQMINSISTDMNLGNLPSNYTIDYRKANKIYVDTDIFALESSKREDVKKLLEEGDYMWLLTLDIENTAYKINISRGLPFDESLKDILTEKEIETIKAQEGKWTVAAIGFEEGKSISYGESITDRLKDTNYEIEGEIVLCGGLKHIHQPVALLMGKEEVELLIALHDLQLEGREEEINLLKPTLAQETEGVYLYSKIKDTVNKMEIPDKDSVGAGGSIDLSSPTRYPKELIAALFLGLLVLVFGLMWIKGHRSS